MIFAIDTDSVLHLFESEEQAIQSLEAIDIENSEYEFCNDKGTKLVAEITTPVTAFRGGSFRFIHAEPDTNLPISFVDRAREIGMTCQGISSLDDLLTFLSQ